jgi:hypothetical protein
MCTAYPKPTINYKGKAVKAAFLILKELIMKTLNLPEFVNSKGEDVVLDWKDDKQAVTKETKASVLVSYKDGKGNTVVNSTDPNTPHLIKSDGTPALLYHYTIKLIANPRKHPGAGYVLPGVRGLSLDINVYTFNDYTEYLETLVLEAGTAVEVSPNKLHDFLKVFIKNEAHWSSIMSSGFHFNDCHGFVRVYPETDSKAYDLTIIEAFFDPKMSSNDIPNTDNIWITTSALAGDSNTIDTLLKGYMFQIIDKGGDAPVIDYITVYVSVHST